jgi:hypothetical protein
MLNLMFPLQYKSSYIIHLIFPQHDPNFHLYFAEIAALSHVKRLLSLKRRVSARTINQSTQAGQADISEPNLKVCKASSCMLM